MSNSFIEMLHATELPVGDPITKEGYAAVDRALRTLNENRALVDAMNAQLAQAHLQAAVPPTRSRH